MKHIERFLSLASDLTPAPGSLSTNLKLTPNSPPNLSQGPNLSQVHQNPLRAHITQQTNDQANNTGQTTEAKSTPQQTTETDTKWFSSQRVKRTRRAPRLRRKRPTDIQPSEELVLSSATVAKAMAELTPKLDIIPRKHVPVVYHTLSEIPALASESKLPTCLDYEMRWCNFGVGIGDSDPTGLICPMKPEDITGQNASTHNADYWIQNLLVRRIIDPAINWTENLDESGTYFWNSNYCINAEPFVIRTLRAVYRAAKENRWDLKLIRLDVIPYVFKTFHANRALSSTRNVEDFLTGSYGTNGLPEIFVAVKQERGAYYKWTTWMFKNNKWDSNFRKDLKRGIHEIVTTTRVDRWGGRERHAFYDEKKNIVYVPGERTHGALDKFIQTFIRQRTPHSVSIGGLRELEHTVQALKKKSTIPMSHDYRGLKAYYTPGNPGTITTDSEYQDVQPANSKVVILGFVFTYIFPDSIDGVSDKRIDILDPKHADYFLNGLTERNVEVVLNRG